MVPSNELGPHALFYVSTLQHKNGITHKSDLRFIKPHIQAVRLYSVMQALLIGTTIGGGVTKIVEYESQSLRLLSLYVGGKLKRARCEALKPGPSVNPSVFISIVIYCPSDSSTQSGT